MGAASVVLTPFNVALSEVTIEGSISINPTYNFGVLQESQKGFWFVPFSSNPAFTGRDKDLEDLFNLFAEKGLKKAIGISGLGGVGKTQLAIQYAYQYRDRYPDGVFWLSGSGNLIQQFAQLSLLTSISTREHSTEQQAALFWRYLQNNQRALVIYDDLQDYASLTVPFLPGLVLESIPAHLIYTTRLHGFVGQSIEKRIAALSEDDALQLLARISERPLTADAFSREYLAARELCVVLGGLPLATDIAGAFLRQNPEVAVADYLERILGYGVLGTLDSSEVEPYVSPTRHLVAISTTLSLSWEAIRDVEAQKLMLAIGQLPQAESIPLSTLSLITNIPLNADAGFPSPLLKSLRVLSSLSLVEGLTGDSVHLHPLVFAFLRSLQTIDGYSSIKEFRQELFENLYGTLGSVKKLDEYVGRAGIDKALADFQIGFYLNTSKDNPLINLARIASQEAHILRNWDRALTPTLFAERVHARAKRIKNEKVAEEAAEILDSLSLPHLRLSWRAGYSDVNLVRTISGHQDEVRAIAITPDGKRLISGSGSLDSSEYIVALGGEAETKEYVIKIWDISSGTEIRTLEGHHERISKLAVTPNGQRVVSASADHTLKVWDINTGKLLHTLEGHKDRVVTVVVFDDGRKAVSGGWDEKIKIWDLEEGREIATIAGHTSNSEHHENYILSLAITEDGNTLISGSRDSTIKIWDLRSLKELRQLDGHLQFVESLAIVPKRGAFFSGSTSIDMLIEWNMNTWEPIRSMRFGSGKAAKDIGVISGTDCLIIADHKQLIVWNMEDDSQYVLGTHDGEIHGIALVPDSHTVISASADRTIKVWDVEHAEIKQQEYHTESIDFLEVTAGSRALVSGSVHITRDESLLKKLQARAVEYSESHPSPELDDYDLDDENGPNFVLSWPYEISLLSHDIDTGEVGGSWTFSWTSRMDLIVLEKPTYPSISLTPDRTRFFHIPQEDIGFETYIVHNSAFYSGDKYTSKLLVPPPLSLSPVKDLFVEFVEGDDSLLKLLLREMDGSYEGLVSFYEHRFGQELVFLPNRNQLISLQQHRMPFQEYASSLPLIVFMVSDFDTGEPVRGLLCDQPGVRSGIEATVVSQSGKYFAAFYMNNLIELWDLETGNKILSQRPAPPELTGSIVEVLFSNDDTRLIVRYEIGGYVVIELPQLEVHAGTTQKRSDFFLGRKLRSAIGKFAVFPNGKMFAEIVDDKVIRVCELTSGNEITRFAGDADFQMLLPAEIAGYPMIFAGDKSGTVWALEFIDPMRV